MEEFKDNAPFTVEEKMCKKHFNDTVLRGNDRRFIVHLLLKYIKVKKLVQHCKIPFFII